MGGRRIDSNNDVGGRRGQSGQADQRRNKESKIQNPCPSQSAEPPESAEFEMSFGGSDSGFFRAIVNQPVSPLGVHLIERDIANEQGKR